jgi:hypothetical protein
MQIRKSIKFCLVISIVLVQAVSWGINPAQNGAPPKAAESLREQVDAARRLFLRGAYSAAIEACHGMLQAPEQTGVDVRPVHVLLGESYMMQGDFDRALPEVGWRWKTDHPASQDLLVSICVVRGRMQDKSSLYCVGQYVNLNHARLVGEVGDLDQLPDAQGEDTREALAWMLEAARPDQLPDQILFDCRQAEALVPHSAITAFLRGKALLTKGQKEAAKKDLKFAASTGQGELVRLAMGELQKIDTLRKS